MPPDGKPSGLLHKDDKPSLPAGPKASAWSTGINPSAAELLTRMKFETEFPYSISSVRR